MTLLIVEDDAEIAAILKIVLKRQGYEVMLAATSRDARLILNEVRPELIILDRYLPDGDGLELCEEARRTESFPRIPILLLSASNNAPEIIAALEIGADEYLAKPFDIEEMLGMVAALIRRSGQPLAGNLQFRSHPA